MIGKSILHYKILEKLGEGGMGIVYKAEDTKLKRQVAIKFLPHHISANSDERKRFEIEAQAAAALNHPNIATIYAIENTNDEIFLVMEYVEGKHLKGYIDLKPLPAEEAKNIAIQIAKGLQAAHKKGIVHRDVKSANIMSPKEGHVKIMDFGLAKFRDSAQMTQIGTTIGTAAYMSPEQARGEEVDPRADIWSFGVVLYEMITGRLPFAGDYEQAVIYNILNEKPVEFGNGNTEDYADLKKVVLKCLEKDKETRYQDMNDILQELSGHRTSDHPAQKITIPVSKLNQAPFKKWISSVAAFVIIFAAAYFVLNSDDDPKERIPIAVVDFDNQTNEAELNGLSGLLITALEQSQRLTVITRSRMLDILKHIGKEDSEYIDEKLGIEICKQANIQALAIASIRKLGNRYVIDLKVLDPLMDEYLFTTKEEGNGQESVFSMIDNLAEKTRSGLKVKTGQINTARQKVADVITTDLKAYQHYFNGEDLISKVEFLKAEDEFRKAIVIDSTFALAYYRLAYAISWWGGEKARVYIRKAMSLIHNLPEKERFYVQAMNALIEEDARQAIIAYKKILSIYPDEKEALYQIGDWSFHQTEYDTSLKYLKKVIAIDPLFESAYQHIIWNYMAMGQFDKAMEYCKNYIARIPGENAYRELGELYYRKKDLENALLTYQKALGIFPTGTKLISDLGELYIFRNEYKKAQIQFEKLISKENLPQTRSIGHKHLAILSAYLGQYQTALNLLDQKIEIDAGLHDSTSLAGDYAEKAFWLLAGVKDEERADLEMEKGLKLQNVANEYFFKPLLNFYFIKKEYQKALIIAQKNLTNPINLIRVNAYLDISAGKYSEAINGFKKGIIIGGYRSPTFYDLGLLYFDLEQYKDAAEVLKKMQVTYQDHEDYFLRPYHYPRSFYHLGKVYEKLNDKKSAIASYQRLIGLWQEADKNIPELIDTKKRLADLKGYSLK